MDLSNKKILYLHCKEDFYSQIKNGEVKSDFREYNKNWIQKFTYPCGTFKDYDLIIFLKENTPESPRLLVELKEIKIGKKAKSWFKTNKFFEIELGRVIKEIP